MKKMSLFLALVLLLTSLVSFAQADWTPDKPVTIMNYVKPGGAMDVTTRKFQEIAAKYTDATLVVENKTGAGGITAADYILDQEADGYTIFGTTVSYLDTILYNTEDVNHYIWGFEWIANIVEDPYCLMVKDINEIDTVEEIVADAKVNPQDWMGPSVGGAKHLIALAYQNVMGYDEDTVPTFNPFTSGPDALLAVISEQGIATVGNPSDVKGRELKHVVIGVKEKLADYPNVPNWTDLGHPELDEISMWRGFAVKKGTPEEAIKWWQDLCEKVKNDPDWIEYNTGKYYNVINQGTEEFTAVVKKDMADHLEILRQYDIETYGDYTIE